MNLCIHSKIDMIIYIKLKKYLPIDWQRRNIIEHNRDSVLVLVILEDCYIVPSYKWHEASFYTYNVY